MKIRKGFVSNSSSASYIVKIKGIDFSEFCQALRNEYGCWGIFSTKGLQNKINSLYESTRNSSIEIFRDEVEEFKNRVDKLGDDNFEDVVKLALDFYNINSSEVKGGIELTDFTTMHNDFDSGMSNIMKEIVLYFMFDTKYKLICERESD